MNKVLLLCCALLLTACVSTQPGFNWGQSRELALRYQQQPTAANRFVYKEELKRLLQLHQ